MLPEVFIQYLVFTLVITLLSITGARAGTVTIPYDNQLSPPPNDLVERGRVIDPDQVMDRIRQGKDISVLDPKVSNIWNPAVAVDQPAYPRVGSAAVFVNFRLSGAGLFRANVNMLVNGKPSPFILLASLDSHAALMRAKLLNQLGYRQLIPKHYPKIKVEFKDEKQKELFLLKLVGDTLPNPNRWVYAQDKNSVVLQDVLLAPGRVELQQYFWGSIADTTLKGRRALRALILPLALLDIGESLNIWSWGFGKKINKSIVLNHPFAEKFQNKTSIDDLRWIGRKIAKMSRADFQQVAQAGQYPLEIEELVVEKLIARRNEMVRLLKFRKRYQKLDYNKRLTIGQVVRGKVKAEFYPGYANRFSHKDPLSPLRFGEMFRYLAMQSINAGLELAADQLGNLAGRGVGELIQRQRKKEFEKLRAAILAGRPYKMGLRAWHGPVGGLQFNSGRNVITGTYYGSDAPVQLVDIVGVGANLGYFGTMAGLPRTSPVPSAQVQASVHRHYVHLRPIPDLQTGFKTDWKSLFIPYYLGNIVKLLDVKLNCDKSQVANPDGLEASSCREEIEKKLDEALKAFQEKMSVGESIIITDTLSMGGNASLAIPLTALLGPVGAMGNAIVSGGHNWLNTRKIMLERTTEGVKVYVQKLKSRGPQVGFDLNFFVNLFHTQARVKKGKADNQFFKLSFDSLSFKKKSETVTALRSLFKKPMNNMLAQYFHPYELDHQLHGRFNNTKLLWFFRDRLRLKHTLKIRPPRSEEHEYDPKEFERTLYRQKEVRRKSRSLSRFGGDVASVIFRETLGVGGSGRPPGQYAANDFWASGQLESISTEVELTPEADFEPVVVHEDVWNGWSIKKKKLLKILDRLEANLEGQNEVKPLFNQDLFHSTKEVHAYEIRSTTIFYPKLINHMLTVFSHASEKNLFRMLAILYGVEEFKHFCKNAREFFGDNGPQVYYGEKRYSCALPFMQTVLKMVEEGIPQDKKARVEAINKLLSQMLGPVSLGRIVEHFGSEGIFHVINVSGFRTYDENGDNALQSHTFGVFDNYLGAGVFRDLANDTGIMNYELNANFFAEGY